MATSLLYGVEPAGPESLMGAAALVTVAVAPAAFIPAARASRVDPAVALRE